MAALNPLSSVDLSAIEQGLKAASLDQHRGYAQDHFAEVHQDRETEYVDESMAAGYQVLREPLWNKGMFSTTHSTPNLQNSIDFSVTLTRNLTV
jgi:malate dehydrogenase (oxaloacetate-decarboxylating)(NADP+)